MHGIIDPAKLLDCPLNHGIHLVFSRAIHGKCNRSIVWVSTDILALTRCLLSAADIKIGKQYASNTGGCVREGTVTANSTSCGNF